MDLTFANNTPNAPTRNQVLDLEFFRRVCDELRANRLLSAEGYLIDRSTQGLKLRRNEQTGPTPFVDAGCFAFGSKTLPPGPNAVLFRPVLRDGLVLRGDPFGTLTIDLPQNAAGLGPATGTRVFVCAKLTLSDNSVTAATDVWTPGNQGFSTLAGGSWSGTIYGAVTADPNPSPPAAASRVYCPLYMLFFNGTEWEVEIDYRVSPITGGYSGQITVVKSVGLNAANTKLVAAKENWTFVGGSLVVVETSNTPDEIPVEYYDNV